MELIVLSTDSLNNYVPNISFILEIVLKIYQNMINIGMFPSPNLMQIRNINLLMIIVLRILMNRKFNICPISQKKNKNKLSLKFLKIFKMWSLFNLYKMDWNVKYICSHLEKLIQFNIWELDCYCLMKPNNKNNIKER